MRRVVETMATSAPSPARRRAVAYPMPLGLPAPVTSATRPSSRSLAGADRVADSVAESSVTPLTDSMGGILPAGATHGNERMAIPGRHGSTSALSGGTGRRRPLRHRVD